MHMGSVAFTPTNTRLSTFAVAVALVILSAGCARPPPPPPISTWGYQLATVDLDDLRRSPHDLLVIDSLGRRGPLAPTDLKSLRASGRVVLGYLSVGEAEEYRFYWDPTWREAPPRWLDEENPQWPRNFAVRFWKAGWQDVLRRQVDLLIGQGFDGMYLDGVDAWEHWSGPDRPQSVRRAQALMVATVLRLTAYARSKKPGFWVIPQNSTELLMRDDYLRAIDGAASENVFYDDHGQDQRSAITRPILRHLERVIALGKPAMVVEYIRPELFPEFRKRARAHNLIPYATVRSLDVLMPPL